MTDVKQKKKEVVIPKGKSVWIFFGKYTGVPIAVREEKPVKGPEQGEPIWGAEGSWKEVKVV